MGKRWTAIKDRAENRLRAEGARLAGHMLGTLAAGTVDTPREDLRRGLLAASGFCGVLAEALESGNGTGIGFADIDGDAVPIDLTLKREGS